MAGVKSTAQQATLTLHRQRELLMKMCTMQTNALRGLLYEFGAPFAKGRKALFTEVEATLESLADQLTQIAKDSLSAFDGAGRKDLADKERTELLVLQAG